MAIKRAKRQTNFTMISNVGLKDKRLSLKAKGLLAYMLSLPDDWIFYESELVNHSMDGKASVKSGLKELHDTGYLHRERKRDDKGRLKESIWLISDEPMSDYPTLGKPTLDKPTLDNQPLLNTNHTKDLSKPNTDNTKNNMSGKPDDASESIPYKEIIEYLNDKADRKYKHSTSKTKSLIKARWNEEFNLEDFKIVIDKKVASWSSNDMSKYLRPETLFGPKFESYLNEKGGRGSDDSEYDDYF